MIRSFTISLLSALALAGCATVPTEAPLAPEVQFGAVSAADPRAEEAGYEMLRAGGNATDAAIATMVALTVVEPQSSGIGGGGFLVRGTADGAVITYDGRETAPAAATPEWFLTDDGTLPPFGESVRSGLSVGVPGNIALAAKAHAEHGKLPWARLFDPAIRLARAGFRINPRLHNSLNSSKDRAAFSEAGRTLFFGADGNPLPVGTLVVNEELARTFEAVAAGGAPAFYRGEMAEALAQAVAQATPRAGAMTAGDVAAYQTKPREALCTTYRRHRVCGMGPPTSGGIAILQMLAMLERFELTAYGVESPVTWHLFLEAQRLAYADREIYLADADFFAVPVAGLLDPAYLASRSALIDPARAMAKAEAGQPAGAPLALADGDEPEERGTTHFAVVDSSNTMISYTSTIEGAFGSGLMFGGFYLNNELTDFSRSPVVDGKPVANRVEGGKRPRSSMSPMLVWAPDGTPLLAVGAAGGPTIPVQTARSIIGVIDFGLDAEAALGLPFIMSFGDRTLVEEGTWLEQAIPAFLALGQPQPFAREAPVKANAILWRGGQWQSARDPRLEAQLELP
ncbi:MAG: gamma-glutamyltransferase [Sphingomonadaceae bacterium]